MNIGSVASCPDSNGAYSVARTSSQYDETLVGVSIQLDPGHGLRCMAPSDGCEVNPDIASDGTVDDVRARLACS